MQTEWLIHIFIFCLLQDCKAQVNVNKDKDFIIAIEQEITNNHFNDTLFNTTVLFKINGERTETKGKLAIQKEWNKIKTIFKGNDYVTNYCKALEDKTICIELKNHNFICNIKINKRGKISEVEEIKINLPPNAPARPPPARADLQSACQNNKEKAPE